MEQRSAAPSAYCVVRSLHLCTRSLLLMDTLAGFEVQRCGVQAVNRLFSDRHSEGVGAGEHPVSYEGKKQCFLMACVFCIRVPD